MFDKSWYIDRCITTLNLPHLYGHSNLLNQHNVPEILGHRQASRRRAPITTSHLLANSTLPDVRRLPEHRTLMSHHVWDIDTDHGQPTPLPSPRQTTMSIPSPDIEKENPWSLRLHQPPPLQSPRPPRRSKTHPTTPPVPCPSFI